MASSIQAFKASGLGPCGMRTGGCATSRPTALTPSGHRRSTKQHCIFERQCPQQKSSDASTSSAAFAFDKSVMLAAVHVGRPRMIARAVGHATTVWNIDVEQLTPTCWGGGVNSPRSCACIVYDTRITTPADVPASIRMVHSTFASTVQTCSLGHEVHPA